MDDNLEAIRERLADDPTMIRKLKAALQDVSSAGSVSMTDAVSLRDWLIELYELPQNYFDDIYIKDLKILAEDILEDQIEQNMTCRYRLVIGKKWR